MANISERTIKGSVYMIGDSLVQDQILLVTTDNKTVREATGMATLVENVWTELKKKNSDKWVSKGKKKKFFWKVEMTDTSGESSSQSEDKLIEYYDCPVPSPEIFDYDFTIDDSNDSEWTKYWKSEFAKTTDSVYNGKNAIYRKEVILPGTKYIKFGKALTLDQDVAVSQTIDGETWTGSEEVVINKATVNMTDDMNLLGKRDNTGDHIQTDLDDISGLLSTLL